ncbi:MAG: TraB family protein [Spirochaetae bacterium HGW-Spirochaetae-3]|jgi:pheromone shutdown-related protein TraB|nr:MAG: TraB family protein [Spirochaetae bacterium HGW-Spirochaetae-3]
MSDTVKALELSGRRIVLVGTAHVSRESVDEVVAVIESEKPDGLCVELDEGRWKSMNAPDQWEKTDIIKVIREGRAFLLLANLALSSFQRRMGVDSGVKPGEEMVAAIRAAEAAGIPFGFCDRDVQTTLRRAWGRSNLWNKSKLVAQLISAAFSSEKPDAAEIERLKVRSELDEMMGELAEYLPSVKEVLIDERDRYIASKIWAMPGDSIVAVIGAGHASGVEMWLGRLASGGSTTDVSDLDVVPPPGIIARSAGWLVPALIVGFITIGFFTSGAEASLQMLLRWVVLNGTLAAVGSVLCLAHPLTVLVSFAAAPIATLNPLVAVGLFSGVVEAWLRKPQVSDFQTLATDVSSFRGFYRNKVTHILLVFFLSSLGGALGNFIALPFLAGGAL